MVLCALAARVPACRPSAAPPLLPFAFCRRFAVTVSEDSSVRVWDFAARLVQVRCGARAILRSARRLPGLPLLWL